MPSKVVGFFIGYEVKITLLYCLCKDIFTLKCKVFLIYVLIDKRKPTLGGLFRVFRMIGITKKGELMIIDEKSSITGHQFIGVIITNPTELDDSCVGIANHFYSKDHQQLDKLVLEALHTNQNHHHLLSVQP